MSKGLWPYEVARRLSRSYSVVVFAGRTHRASVDSREVVPAVVLDFDEETRLAGIDINDAGKILVLIRLENQPVRKTPCLCWASLI